jgi:NAD(P)-dependent dehydrogenase (short-subunit alcohol dehydrogenase family)
VYAKAKRAQVVLSENWAKELAGTGVSFHAMHPGWVDTPGIAVALPGFYRMMRPLLRTPQQGADTIIWLATADPARLGTGRFWHDRRPRSEYRLPRTRNAPTTSTRGFWHHVRAASGIWDQ